VEVIERRVAWLTISVAIVLAFTGSGGFYALGGLGTWELVAFIATLVCLGAAGALLVTAMAPDAVRAFGLGERERFVFFAFALWAIAVILVVVLASHAAIEAHRHSNGFGG
jgi:hypothetical protein